MNIQDKLYDLLDEAIKESIAIENTEGDGELYRGYASAIFALYDVLVARQEYSSEDIALMIAKIGNKLVEAQAQLNAEKIN